VCGEDASVICVCLRLHVIELAQLVGVEC